MHVVNTVSGSTCVVCLTHTLTHHDAAYIDARNDVRQPDVVHLEYVRSGFVRYRCTVSREMAPAYTVAMVKHLRSNRALDHAALLEEVYRDR